MSARHRVFRPGGIPWGVASLAILLGVVASCTDEKIVYRDVPVERQIPPPPDSINGFVGYFDVEIQKTACGNCHVSYQANWAGTAHQGAWASLMGSGHAASYCYGCHSISETGNPLEEAGGINVVETDQYYDVQCESCHGPGYVHMTNPDLSQPIVSIQADTATGCGECHQGTHHPYAEEWMASRHSNLDDHAAPNVASGCANCHQAKYALESWGVEATYQEMGGSPMVAITCAVCHDPHAKKTDGQLRFSIEERGEENLCYQCHHKRGVPDPNTWRGPHSPEGPMVFGEAGWYPPGFPYGPGDIIGTHGSTANERTCATCHVNRWTATDPATGEFSRNGVGHTFEATPWVDAGLNLVEEGTPGATQYYGSCATGGCHGSPDAARSAVVAVNLRFDRLVRELWVDTDADGRLDYGTDGGLLAQVPATEFVSGDAFISVGEGALFNTQLMMMGGSRTHNPFLGEALLLASIDAVEQTYGLAASAALTRSVQAVAPPSLVAGR